MPKLEYAIVRILDTWSRLVKQISNQAGKKMIGPVREANEMPGLKAGAEIECA